MNDQLCHQAIVVRWDRIARVQTGIDANRYATGRVIIGDKAGGRGERFRVLRRDTALDGMTFKRDVGLFERQW